jgi:hypothetical protein
MPPTKSSEAAQKKRAKDIVAIPDAPFVLNMPPVETGGCSVLMVGSGRSGKTFALKYLLDNYFKKHVGSIFSQSAKAEAYSNMKYPLLPLSSCYIPELINSAYRINKETQNHYPFLYVLDDVPLAKNDKELLKTLTIYRNSGVSCIQCVQTPTLVNPTCRSNFTFMMLFKCNATEQIENICKCFLRGYFPPTWRMEDKIAWYKAHTEDHYFIFLDHWAGTIQRCKIGE